MLIKEITLYPDRTDVTLTAYIIADKGQLLNQGPRPAILICPGGAYLSCSDKEAEPIALKFTAMGYHAFVLRYSTYSGKNDFMPELSKPLPPLDHCQFPAPAADIGKAMLIITQHAGSWSIDTNRIAICGFSAGAHNAAMYGVYWNKPLIQNYLNIDCQLPRPSALILGYPLTDYIFTNNSEKTPFADNFCKISNTAYFGCPFPDDSSLIKASPALLIDQDVPPAFLWATSDDSMVPVQNSLKMALALADHRIPFEMHIFESGNHGLSAADQTCALAKSEINPVVSKWVEQAEIWLSKRFALTLPDTSGLDELINQF